MEEELYEELPEMEQEELYEDLPESAYNDYPTPNSTSSPYSSSGYQSAAAPPPLPPSSSIPQHRPGGPAPFTSAPPPPTSAPPSTKSAVPPLPTRSPNTQLTSPKQVPPPQGKKGKDGGKKKAPPPPKSSGPAGLDMNEILKRAKARPRNFEDLEKKKEAEPEEKPVVPWANQLRRTPQHKPSEEGKRASLSESQEEDVPEFIRKARTLSIADTDDEIQPTSPPAVAKKPSSPISGRKPPAPGIKPRNMNPAAYAPKAPVDAPTVGDKPNWQKQRERQLALSQGDSKPAKPVPAEKPGGKPSPPQPGVRPVPAGKPPLPDKGSPAVPQRNPHSSGDTAPQTAPKLRPT